MGGFGIDWYIKLRASKTPIMYKDKDPSICSPQKEAIVFIIHQIFFTTHAVWKIGDYINNSLHLAWKYVRILILSLHIMCSKWRTVFRLRSSRKTVSFEEQT